MLGDCRVPATKEESLSGGAVPCQLVRGHSMPIRVEISAGFPSPSTFLGVTPTPPICVAHCDAYNDTPECEYDIGEFWSFKHNHLIGGIVLGH